MAKQYRVLVFGKAGCSKCKVLNQRLETLLQKPEWEDFEKRYCDLDTEDGLLDFCKAECINPQRIPAFVVERQDEQAGAYRAVADPHPGGHDDFPKSRLYHVLGMQTDYSEEGKGIISPKMIKTVLQEARGT